MSDTMSDKLDKVKGWAESQPDSIAFYIILWMELNAETGLRKATILLDILGADLTKSIAEHLNATRRAKIALAIYDLNPTVEEQEQVLDSLLASGSFQDLLAAKIYCQQEVLHNELR